MTQPVYKLNKPWTVKKFSIVFKDVFSMEFLYKRLHDWLVEEGYQSRLGNGKFGSDKWLEKLYLERISNNGMKQIWIWWRAGKIPDGRSFFKFYLNVDFHVLGLTNHEMVVNGKKIKTHKGEVEVFVEAKMELDPAGEWKKGMLLKNKHIQKLFFDRVYKKSIEDVEGMLIKDCTRFLGAIKQYFQLESWLPEYTGEHFHPKKGEY